MDAKRAVALVAAVGLALTSAGGLPQPVPVQAQPAGSDMQQRLDQLINVLRSAPPVSTAGAAIDDAMEILYGGLRPLPSKGDMQQETTDASGAVSQAEMRLAQALQAYATGGDEKKPSDNPQRGRALDLKLFIEQMNEVARAVGELTQQCGQGDSLEQPPCDELKPVLDEQTGQEMPASGPTTLQVTTIEPGYSVKLRSPFVPVWFGGWEEDVRVTHPIASGECAVVFKETRGLMVRLHFDGVTVVTDPWVSTFGVPRGTRTRFWRLEWIPTEYAKEWNICNSDGRIEKDVTQRVVQDVPMNFNWRLYHKDP